MKLLNISLLYLSFAFFVIIGIWSLIFYYNLKDEIRDSIDDGLDNNRILIIQKVHTDSTLLLQKEFGGNNFKIYPTSKQTALQVKDTYKDTLMYRLNENDLEPVRILHTAFEYENKYYGLHIISSLVEEDDLIEDSFWSVVWLFVILVGSIIVINNVVLRKVWHPFYDILSYLKTYRLDAQASPINISTNTKEFIELQKASNALIRHATEAYTSQKQFTENASHELQTPLAIIINKLELLLESEDLKHADAQAIASIIKIADRLTQLNKSLLLLAKIENKQFTNTKAIIINELGHQYKSNFEEFTYYKEIDINIEEVELLKVNMDPTLAEILILNLTKNAVFHNVKGGQIKMYFTRQEFRICNTSNGIPLYAEKIFKRFTKEAKKTDSTGIGLALCKAICDFYDMHLSYEFSQNEHCFSVNFKKIMEPQ
ncbi:Signal transduction histidine kinase [Saccharicrinis carchari]|uniref:histidine kinase n=1 Tax=Saccharicrinis carchari TaxID=1168039 RepID=A0A521EUY8_SACCC|nr:HAMP domain-containing sensor histidine kinase [Saccharicrinis carchari]SMO87743.1 Signal transduction histidine kinase [Saccharicrinis carchari]